MKNLDSLPFLLHWLVRRSFNPKNRCSNPTNNHHTIQKKMSLIPHLFCVFFISLWSCTDDQTDSFPIQFEFRLLNVERQPSTIFNEGENFVFSFLIINNSNELITLQSFDTQDFFKVYRITESEGESELGKPYNSIFCEYSLGYPIPSGDTLKIERPWVTPDSIKSNLQEYFNNSIICGYTEYELLTSGSYSTHFKSVFIFSNNGKSFSTSVKQFEINFKFNLK